MNIMQNKVDKLISLRFAESSDPIATEALETLQLQNFDGTSFNEVWEARTRMVAEWYKCWKAEQERQYEGVTNG